MDLNLEFVWRLLAGRSRRPDASPWTASGPIEAAALATRTQDPTWGGRRIAAPSVSTAIQILHHHGVELGAFSRGGHCAANDLWRMDFTGHVGIGSDGGRLHPLAVLDEHSRFCLALDACADREPATIKSRLVRAFKKYGLPRRITADSGPLCGGAEARGVASPWTTLSVWLLEHDVALNLCRPHRPQTKGKDEGFHRTLEAEVLSGPHFADLDQTAQRLQAWRAVYNTQRIQEALGQMAPVDRYTSSPRRYRKAVQPFAYGPNDALRRVNHGCITFRARRICVPEAFSDKTVALRPTDIDGQYHLVFRTKTLATVDLRRPM